MRTLSEADQLAIDLLEMRERIAMFVLWGHGHSVANIGIRMKRSESWLKDWIAAGCPLQDAGKPLEPVDSALVTATTTQDATCVLE